jgi:hypothetical protein
MARVLDVRKKIAPSKCVTLRPIPVLSSALKEHFWDIVTRMKTAVGFLKVSQMATAKMRLTGIRKIFLMEPIMVITAQLSREILQNSKMSRFIRCQHWLSKLNAMMTNQNTH